MYAVATDPDLPIVIGIDLAWGTRAPSGIAVLDASGELLATAAVHTDEELDDVVAPWIGGPCVVAFDAPLHVVNATGRRPCEAELTRAFAAQHAGTYPSNTGMPHFADGGRAARLARRYELTSRHASLPRPGSGGPWRSTPTAQRSRSSTSTRSSNTRPARAGRWRLGAPHSTVSSS